MVPLLKECFQSMASERTDRLSKRAESDLEDIWLYTFESWSLEQAESYHSLLNQAFDGFAANTKVGRIADIRDGYFKHSVGSHLIFYTITNTNLDVVRILHQRMDVTRHLN